MANEAGQGCVARDGSYGGYTRVSEGGPASQSGSCNKLSVYATGSSSSPFKFNFFTAVGNNLTAIGTSIDLIAGNTDIKCHVFNAPGDFTAFSVNSGEYLGCYCSMAQHRGSSGGAGLWSKSGDYSEASSDAFSLDAERLDALSADIVAAGGWTGTITGITDPAEIMGRACSGITTVMGLPYSYEAFNVTDNGGEVFRVTDGGGEDFRVKQ